MSRWEEPRKPCRFWRWTKRFFVVCFVLVLISVPVGYFLGPKILKSDCTKAKLERELSRSVGAPVHIGRLDFSWKKGWTAHDVRTDAARMGDMSAVWTARELQIRPKPLKLLSKQPKVAVDLRDPHLELAWRGDVANLPAPQPRAPKLGCRARGIDVYDLSIENGSVRIDHPSFVEPVVIDHIHGHAGLEAKKGEIELKVANLRATLNGGTISAHGRLEIREGRASGRVALDSRSVEINDFVAESIRNFQPMIEVMPGGDQRGDVSLKLDAQGEASDLDGLLRALSGSGELQISGASIQGSKLLRVVGEASDLPDLVAMRVSEVGQKFDLRKGRVLLKESVAQASSGSAWLTGWIDFDGTLDVVVRLDPRLGQGGKEPVRVVGTVEEPVAMPK